MLVNGVSRRVDFKQQMCSQILIGSVYIVECFFKVSVYNHLNLFASFFKT